MKKKVSENMTWFYVALVGIGISLLSLFQPVLMYARVGFNIVDLIKGDDLFNQYVLANYWGPVYWYITPTTITILALLAIVALACAIIGLLTLRTQRPNKKNFVLTIIGLVGIMIPSLTAIVCVVVLGDYFDGNLRLGLAPIISPIAIIVSIAAVIRRKNKAAEALRKEVEKKGLIWEAKEL